MNDSTKGLISSERVGSAILSRAAPRRGYGPRSAAPAGARDRDRSRRPARPGRAAATVLVVGLVLLGAAAAEAQTAPYVFAVSRVSADGTYNLGETISLNVVFNAAVTVTGTPQLALEIGTDTTPRANYASGSGTETLQFDYEVVAGDEDTDGIGVPEDALTLNGGTISAGGTPANVTLGSASFSGILVDGGPAVVVTAPTVTGVALTSDPGTDATYAIDDAVNATVTFSAAVDITGTPQLELDFDGTPKPAGCAAAMNTTTMVCAYTVVENDSAPNGIAIAANKLTLNGGTIRPTGSTTTNAVLTHSAVAIDSGHKVDGVRPTLVTTGNDAPQTSADGTQVIYTFSEDIGSVTLNSFNLEVDNGPNQQAGATATISGRTVTVTLLPVFTIQYGQAVEITLGAGSVRDTAGNRNSSIEDQAVTNTIPPPPAVISMVEITSDPGTDQIYATGDDVEVTATFDQAVAVSGTPRIEVLLIGGVSRGDRWAEYASGSGSTALVFAYTVLVTDESDTDGIGVGVTALTADHVDLNGGTITVVATGENASLSFTPVLSDSGHRVNWARPTLSGAVTSTDGTKVLLTFSEDLDGTAVGHSLFTVKVDDSAVTLSGTTATVSGNVVTLTLATALTSATQAVTVSYADPTTGDDSIGIEDLAGNDADSFTDQTVTNAVGSATTPTVTAVALTSAPGSDNTYAIGDAVEATVTFSEAVDITAAPQLELDFAGTAKAAACATGTNTTTTACSYTVVVGDVAAGGIAIAANKLTGGTITATGSTTVNADLDHVAVAIDVGQKVDGIRPTLVTTGSEAPKTSTDGTKVILTFSETISAVDQTKIIIGLGGSNVASTSAANVVADTTTTVELTLTTALTTTATTITVALDDDAVDDAAGNGNLVLAATTVTNAVGTTAVVSPDVSSVELTSDPGTDNTYAIGDTVTATVTFSAAVDITGTPQLELDVAGTAKAAACTAATNTTTTACEYEVVAGDSAPNGIAIGANKLTGGTIYATGGTTTSADLTHVAVAIDVGHKVDGIRPTLVTTGSEAPKTSTDGTQVILTFSEDIGGVSRSDITIQANSVTAATSAASVTGTTVELTLTTALTTTSTNLTVELAADAGKDDAGNGILAVAATAVTNAVGTTVSNTAPTFANPTETRSVAENSAVGTNVGAPVTATDTDSGDMLAYTLEGTDADSFTIVSTSGQIRTRAGVTYDYETTPSYTVTVKADDNNGGTDTVTVTIDLTDDVDERPLAPTAPTVTATPNTTDSLTVSWSAPSNTGRPAIESYDLQYREGTTRTWTNGPQGVSGTSATIAGLTAARTAYQVQVRATNADGAGDWSPPGRIGGGGGGGGRNEPPLAVDDAAQTAEDTPAFIDVLGNDSDPDGDTLTVVEVSAPAHGTARLTDAGTVEYTPEPDFHGIDRFTYVVDDGTGETARATVEVTVQPVNDPPQALDDAADTPEDTPVTIAVLENDSDPDGDALALVEVSAPAHGTARLTDAGTVEYTPEPDFHGSDRFTYAVGDGSGLTAQAAVAVTVLPVNDPPQALDDAADTPEDTPVTIAVLENDSDGDGDALALVEASAPAHGTARLTDAGAVEYTPEPDYHGSDRFTYVVGDGSGLTARAAVDVTVLTVNDPPLATGVIPDQTLDVRDGPASLDLIPFFEDRDGDDLGYTAVASDQAVALRLTGATLTLTVTRPGAATVTVTAQDPGGLTATQAFLVTTTDHQARGVVEDTLAALGRGHLASARATLGRRVETTGQEASRVTVPGDAPAPLGSRVNPVVVQDPLHRGPSDLVAEVRERPADPCVPPLGILDRHPDHERGHVASRHRPASPAAGAAVVGLGDQAPVPAKDRLRGGDTSDLRQDLPAEFLASHGESTALGVGQAKRSRAQVLPEDPILLPEIRDHIILVAVHPASERENEEL